MPKATNLQIYNCVYCDKKFSSEERAKEHEASHDLIYVSMEKKDYSRLLSYLSSKFEEAGPILGEEAWKALFKQGK